jgi:hypothetical protein
MDFDPAPVTARDKLLADTLRQLELLHAEEERTKVEVRRDSSALKQLESEYLQTVDAARYTDGRPFSSAGAIASSSPWERSVDAEGTIESLESRFSEREAQLRREKDRLKRFTDKRFDLLSRLTTHSRHLLTEADWAAAADYLRANGHPPEKAGSVDAAVTSLQHHAVHAEGLLHALLRVHVVSATGGGGAAGSTSARRP